MSVARLLQTLKCTAQRRPLLINSVIYGSFYTAAEFTQQTIRNVMKVSESQKQGKSQSIQIRASDYDWIQLRRYAIYGSLVAGPILHGWYKWMDSVIKGKGLQIVLLKLFCDQFIITPPMIVLFYVCMGLLEGKTSNVFDECAAKFVHTFKTACVFWIPIQFLNFLLMPPALRVTFVSIAVFCWVNILCYLKSTSLYADKT